MYKRQVDGVGHGGALGAQHGGEDLAQRGGLGVGVQQVDVGLEGVDLEGGEELGRGVGGAEAAQALEGGEGADELGLVVGVLVVAVRGVERDAAGLLVGVAGPGLLEVGVDLEGEGVGGGEELEQEGQARAEAPDGVGAELALGVGGDDVAQRERAGVGAAVDGGGGAGVVAHPQLGLGFAGGRGAEQLGDRGGGAPGVGAHGVEEAVHGTVPGGGLGGVRDRFSGLARPVHGVEASAR